MSSNEIDVEFPRVKARTTLVEVFVIGDRRIRCEDETGEEWTTTVREFVCDNADHLDDRDINAIRNMFDPDGRPIRFCGAEWATDVGPFRIAPVWEVV